MTDISEQKTPEVQKFKIVVSDFHMGKGRVFKDGSQNILEDFGYDKEFAEFIDYYSTGPFATADVELVLNGDILNLLQMDTYGVYTHHITERSVVRSVKRIIEGHPLFFRALSRFSAIPNHKISYIVGNHDVGMLWHGPRKVFSDACGAEISFYDVAYQFDGVYVEHGQQYERFARINMNRPFITRKLPEPVLNLPWGSLFVAVLLPLIKRERPHVDKVRPFQYFISWSFLHDFIWSVKTVARIGKFIFDTILFHRRYQISQSVKTTFGLLKEITLYPSFDKIAIQKLEKNTDINIIIFGHTHILKYRQWKENKEYFNTGTWNEVTNLDLSDYGTKTRLTYAFVEYVENKPKVRIKEWKGFWKPDMDVLV